jgi:hypothetical protein
MRKVAYIFVQSDRNYMPDFNQSWNAPTCFSKNPSLLNLTGTHSAGLELLHADEQADMAKLTDAFLQTHKMKARRTLSLNCIEVTVIAARSTAYLNCGFKQPF